jgi:hypothetical protein
LSACLAGFIAFADCASATSAAQTFIKLFFLSLARSSVAGTSRGFVRHTKPGGVWAVRHALFCHCNEVEHLSRQAVLENGQQPIPSRSRRTSSVQVRSNLSWAWGGHALGVPARIIFPITVQREAA